MEIHFVMPWWASPAAFTILALAWVLWDRDSEGGNIARSVGLLFRSSFAFALCGFAWAVAGALK